MDFHIEVEQEEDGRWIAEITDISGCLAYGATSQAAIAKAKALALRIIADQLEENEQPASLSAITFAPV